jgi:hypothetical protein
LYSAPFNKVWTRLILTASKTRPASWYRKPARMKSISPKEAMTTPSTMKETLKSFMKLTSSTLRAQLVRRTATGMVAWHG